jgi:TetR/AcrR family transcriptional regulator
MPSPALSRKERILECAEQHFANFGFQGASLSAMARDCDLGNPGLLHHFPSKEALYRAVLEKQAQGLMDSLSPCLNKREGDGDVPARVQAYVALQVQWMQEQPVGFKLITRELLDNAERIATAQVRPLEAFLRASLALLQQAQAAGAVRTDVPAVVLLTLLLGSLNYAQIVRPTFEKTFAEPALHSDALWIPWVAQELLRILGVVDGGSEGGAAGGPDPARQA